MMMLADVAAATGAILLRGNLTGRITGISTDTRTLRPGELFIALIGENMDGNRFVTEAFKRGATAALVSRAPDIPTDGCVLLVDDTLLALGKLASAWRKRFNLPLIAITGSVGKTTTKEMTASILSQGRQVLKTPVNFNNEIGVPLTLLQLQPEHKVAVVEFGMRGTGQIRYLTEITAPTVGVITNVGISHMELLGSAQAIAAAKGELLDAMDANSVAILNCESEYYPFLRKKVIQNVTFGIECGDVHAVDIQTEGEMLSFRLWLPDALDQVASGMPVADTGQWLEIRMPTPGVHNVLNALAAASAAACVGATSEDIVTGLASLDMVAGRMRILQTPGDFTIIDDTYNASPDSMRAALAVLDEMQTSNRIAVLGEMRELGVDAPMLHRSVGRDAAGAHLSLLITVGELGKEIALGAADAQSSAAIVSVADGQAALEVLNGRVHAGDTVLVKASRALGLESVVQGLLDM